MIQWNSIMHGAHDACRREAHGDAAEPAVIATPSSAPGRTEASAAAKATGADSTKQTRQAQNSTSMTNAPFTLNLFIRTVQYSVSFQKNAPQENFLQLIFFGLFCFFRKRQLEPERRSFAFLTVHAIGDVVRFQNTAHDA